MTAEPAGYVPSGDPQDEAVVAVPLAEYRRLRALERHASPQDLDEAAASAALEEYREWDAAGRPGALPHAQVRQMLLGNDSR